MSISVFQRLHDNLHFNPSAICELNYKFIHVQINFYILYVKKKMTNNIKKASKTNEDKEWQKGQSPSKKLMMLPPFLREPSEQGPTAAAVWVAVGVTHDCLLLLDQRWADTGPNSSQSTGWLTVYHVACCENTHANQSNSLWATWSE